MEYQYWQKQEFINGRYVWQWRWHLKAGNNRIIANSGEGYYNEQDCLAAIELVKNSKSAPVRKVA